MYGYGFSNTFRTIGGVSFDADAQAFITAASITDPTQQSAVNQLVVDLKAASIWTKMKAVYPFVGGSASTHKWNLKDPRDLDAAFRLGFNGGWTHSSTGALPNGSNAYANTYLAPSSVLSLNSTAFGLYSRTNADGNVWIGVETSPDYCAMALRNGGTFYTWVNSGSVVAGSYATSDSKGLHIANRIDANTINGWIRGVKRNNQTKASGSLPTHNFYFGVIE